MIQSYMDTFSIANICLIIALLGGNEMIWADWLILILSIILIVLVALQSSQDDLADAFSGEKSELFKNQKQRGFEFILTMTTLVVSVCFLTLLVLNWFNVFPR